MCLGRNVAKQHVLMTVASILARFEIEFINYVHHKTGKISDREPEHVSTHIGFLALPPDRDMKVRWKKVW